MNVRDKVKKPLSFHKRMEQSRRVAITGVAALIPRRRTDTYRLDNVFSNK